MSLGAHCKQRPTCTAVYLSAVLKKDGEKILISFRFLQETELHQTWINKITRDLVVICRQEISKPHAFNCSYFCHSNPNPTTITASHSDWSGVRPRLYDLLWWDHKACWRHSSWRNVREEVWGHTHIMVEKVVNASFFLGWLCVQTETMFFSELVQNRTLVWCCNPYKENWAL